MWGRGCLRRIFHKLIQYRNPPFKMWNFIIKFLKQFCMFESIQVIKLLLNNILSFGRFKKDYISRYNKLLINLIIEMLCFGGIWIPQEDMLTTPWTKFVSLFLWYQGITGERKDLEILYERNVAIPHFIRSLVSNNIRWTSILYIYNT